MSEGVRYGMPNILLLTLRSTHIVSLLTAVVVFFFSKV